MPVSLRAFLMIRTEKGGWTVSVYRDLESLVAAWRDRSDPAATLGGVIHVGFDRPPSREFDHVIENYPGRVLLTAAARFALPTDFQASRTPVGHVGSLPIFLGLRGWGYLIEEPAETTPRNLPTALARAVEGWVRDFLIRSPETTQALQEAEIWDEESYLAGEARLPAALRHQLGAHRLRHLLGSGRDDPCAFAQASPPWLKDRALSSMPLTVRLSNVFRNLGLATVGDLATQTNLLEEKNFGRTSLRDLMSSLEEALGEGPFIVSAKLNDAATIPLLTSIRRSLLRCGGREADILRRRMGLDGAPQTLQQIGESYDLTRERIRQIEAKVIKRLQREEYWDDLVTAKLTALLHDRDFPLPVLGVEAADPWFAGMGALSEALHYVLEDICGCDARILTIDGIEYLGFLRQESWESLLREARRLLEDGAESGWTEKYARSIVEGLLPDSAREFRSLLWDKASLLCHFADDICGTLRLTAYGRGAEQVVEAVLNESERPLHFSEIAPLASIRAGREIDIRRAHNCAASIGLLLGRGTYGVDRHLPLDADSLAVLGLEAEEVVWDGPAGRQWHASEILATLGERGLSYPDAVDKYLLDIALQRSGGLRRLGRMVWAGHQEAGDVARRIDQRQATIALLQQAGRPLRTNEIHQRLVAIRGVNEYFQITGADPLIRLGTGVWGLNDRDISVKRPQQKALLDSLADALQQRGTALHATELGREILAKDGLPITALFSLCAGDPRFRVNAAHYLYLSAWGDPRRQSITEAVDAALLSAAGPLSLDEIHAEVEARIGRSCERMTISGCLQAIEATWNEVTGEWSPPLAPTYQITALENLDDNADV